MSAQTPVVRFEMLTDEEFVGFVDGAAFCSIDDMRGCPLGDWRLEMTGLVDSYHPSLQDAIRTARDTAVRLMTRHG